MAKWFLVGVMLFLVPVWNLAYATELDTELQKVVDSIPSENLMELDEQNYDLQYSKVKAALKKVVDRFGDATVAHEETEKAIDEVTSLALNHVKIFYKHVNQKAVGAGCLVCHCADELVYREVDVWGQTASVERGQGGHCVLSVVNLTLLFSVFDQIGVKQTVLKKNRCCNRITETAILEDSTCPGLSCSEWLGLRIESSNNDEDRTVCRVGFEAQCLPRIHCCGINRAVSKVFQPNLTKIDRFDHFYFKFAYVKTKLKLSDVPKLEGAPVPQEMSPQDFEEPSQYEELAEV